MRTHDQQILVAIDTAGASAAERVEAAAIAFRHAERLGIDSIRLQTPFMRDPPEALAEAVKQWLKTGRRRIRFIVFDKPSANAIELALAASSYLKAVNLVSGGRVVVSVIDHHAALALEVSRAKWEDLKDELESVLGSPLRYDVADLDT